MDAGSCNACHVTGTPLMKQSLGKDFFGRTYDRLSPASDQSPKWYCDPCSMMKHLQRDFRDIHAEFDKLDERTGFGPVGAGSETARAAAPPGDCRHRGHSGRRLAASQRRGRQAVDRAISHSSMTIHLQPQ